MKLCWHKFGGPCIWAYPFNVILFKLKLTPIKYPNFSFSPRSILQVSLQRFLHAMYFKLQRTFFPEFPTHATLILFCDECHHNSAVPCGGTGISCTELCFKSDMD